MAAPTELLPPAPPWPANIWRPKNGPSSNFGPISFAGAVVEMHILPNKLGRNHSAALLGSHGVF